jgi:hypothetical protein
MDAFAKKRGKEADYWQATKLTVVKTTTLEMFQNAKQIKSVSNGK